MATPETPEIRLPSKSGKGKSSLQIIEELIQQFYGVPESVSHDNPDFMKMVLIDLKAALLRSESNKSSINELKDALSNATAILSAIKNSKATAAFHPQYAQELAPLQSEANQRLMQQDQLENEIASFVIKMQNELKSISKEMK